MKRYLLVIFMTAFATICRFGFANEKPADKITDLLSLEIYDADTSGYELSKVLKGDFLPDDGDELLVIREPVGFKKKEEKKFWVHLARIKDNMLEIQKGGSQFFGMPISLAKGKIRADETYERAFVHWRDTEGMEYVNALNSSGEIDEELYKGRAVKTGRDENIALADMDGDGIDEVVTVSLRSEKSSSSEIDKVIVDFVSPPKQGTESYAIIPAPVLDLDVKDIDGDGKEEIITLRETVEKGAKQAIWAIKRNDDGSYSEIPIVTSSNIELAPSPAGSDIFYYLTSISASGHYYHWINSLKPKGNDFEKVNTFRLLPEGLVLAMSWGHFFSSNEISLALIFDETLAKRRWVTIYTPIADGNIINRCILFTSDDFFPKGDNVIPYDIDNDDRDELIYINEKGNLIFLDLQTQQQTPLRIKDLNK